MWQNKHTLWQNWTSAYEFSFCFFFFLVYANKNDDQEILTVQEKKEKNKWIKWKEQNKWWCTPR